MKVAIYGRTNEQAQQCRDYAKQNKYEVANEFIDDQDTGNKSFERLIEAAADFDGVVIKDREDLSKDTAERETKMKALRQSGLETVFVNQS